MKKARRPPPREATVLSAIREYLDILMTAGLLTYVRIHVGPVLRSTPQGSVFTRNRDMIGLSDLLVFLRDGGTLFLEVKSTEGRLSEGQKEFREKLERIGIANRYHVVRSVEEAAGILSQYGCGHWAYPPEASQRVGN